MHLEKEDVFPILNKMNQVFDQFKKYLIVDQWLQEMTEISYVLSFLDSPKRLWYFGNSIEGGYSFSEVMIKNSEKNKEVMIKFLDGIHGRGNYLWHISSLKRLKNFNVQMICICKSPIKQKNIGKYLFSNVFAKFVDGLRQWFEKLDQCMDEKEIVAQSQIDNKEDYVSEKLEKAIAETIEEIETFYYPIKLSYINGLSGEYYEKSECNSTLVFLPWCEDKEINERALEFDFRNEEILFKPNEFRRIRKLMQIAQKDLYLLFLYDKNEEMYKILGISKQENVDKIFSDEENEQEKLKIPWANATIKKHMQWELRIGDHYILSGVNGNYRISAWMSKEYLKDKCTQIFGRDEEYEEIIAYVEESCKQSHGTMLVVISDKNAKDEAERFTEGKFGMINVKEDSEVCKLDINSFNAIDGSIIMDTQGTILAIGVILDGAIRSEGNMARGARFNSAIKYKDYLSEKNIPGMILIVSEDGAVEILCTQKNGQKIESKQQES